MVQGMPLNFMKYSPSKYNVDPIQNFKDDKNFWNPNLEDSECYGFKQCSYKDKTGQLYKE